MQEIREQKTTLIRILTGDGGIVLQYVHQAKLITDREYNNLKDKLRNLTREEFIIDLLDKLIEKGDTTCRGFLEVLQYDEMQQTFPLLSDLFIPPALRQVEPVQETSETPKFCEYIMSSCPRGVCVIINNEHFDKGHLSNRRGSNKDVESLREVFSWLGFIVEVHIDQKAEEMKKTLKALSLREHQGDCFVCCILSHQGSCGFYGSDGDVIIPSDILQPFGRVNCPSLADKPKVFILHTCLESAHYAIPDSDFLLCLATIPEAYSYRHVVEGSWFIQSLYKMLKEGCKRGDDILTILFQVIEEVSTNNTRAPRLLSRQIPEVDLTLRKRIFFRVPDQDLPNP